MQFITLLTLLATVSAAPHAHSQHQNRSLRRRNGPLLHSDLLALYNDPTTASTDATSTTDNTDSHGPYAAGEAHGGNPNAANTDSSTATSSDAATTTETAAAVSSDSWTIAAASRNTTMYSHAYNSADSDASSADTQVDEDEDEDDDDDDEPTGSSKVPAWAIALATILSVTSVGGVATFLYFKYYRTLGADSDDVAGEKKSALSKKDPEDALSSYKAFWEQKRKSAGSFTSADANPAALASDAAANALGLRHMSGSSNTTLPLYQEQDLSALRQTIASPAGTPMNEQAPPAGFLYQ